MAKVSSIGSAAKRLDGGSCLNQRSILAACELFDPPEATSEPLPLNDLLEALWFLELSIVSRAITYDGTLPPQFLNTLSTRLGEFGQRAGFADGYFDGISPSDFEEQKRFMASAAARALDDITAATEDADSGPPGVLDGLDKDFPTAKAESFFAALQELRILAEQSEDDVPPDEALDHIANRSDVAGGKCVAGIAACGVEAIDKALAVAGEMKIAPERAMSVLINRFRFTYVRQLAFGAQDVYVPAARWKSLSEFHAFSFAEVVRRSLEERYAGALSRDIKAEFDQELGGDGQLNMALPPIGLYALMRTSATARPLDVVIEARAEFENYGNLFRKFWSETRSIKPPEGGWTVAVGDTKIDAVHDRIEQELQEKLKALQTQARCGHPSLLERFVAPVLSFGAAGGAGAGGWIGGGIEVLIGAPTGGALGKTLGGAAGYYVGSAASKLGEIAKTYLCGHVDDYRALDQAIAMSSNQLRLDRLADKVEAVFGRPLGV